jgi:hypothetical protein
VRPLGVDGKTPHQPRDENQDDYDDEKQRSGAGGGEQDHCGEQSRNSIDEK